MKLSDVYLGIAVLGLIALVVLLWLLFKPKKTLAITSKDIQDKLSKINLDLNDK